MPSSVLLQAPAKLNLLLRVTEKRSDGFHNLVSLFHPVTQLCDGIKADLCASEGLTMSCDAPEIPVDESNLLLKAAKAFADKRALSPCWHFDLAKKIPAAAGMGGGSSDAGTVLKFLNETFPGCTQEELTAIAKSIGADVPFFLAPQDAAVRGIGEKITPLGTLPMPFILAVSPNFPVRAVWAYKHLAGLTPPEKAEEELSLLTEALKKENFSEAARLCANDLEQPLFAKFPLLCHLRQLLTEKGALCVHVSGSGPLLYAFFESKKAMQSAAAALETPEYQDPGIKAIMC